MDSISPELSRTSKGPSSLTSIAGIADCLSGARRRAGTCTAKGSLAEFTRFNAAFTLK
jgi:hypothetical protein